MGAFVVTVYMYITFIMGAFVVVMYMYITFQRSNTSFPWYVSDWKVYMYMSRYFSNVYITQAVTREMKFCYV